MMRAAWHDMFQLVLTLLSLRQGLNSVLLHKDMGRQGYAGHAAGFFIFAGNSSFLVFAMPTSVTISVAYNSSSRPA